MRDVALRSLLHDRGKLVGAIAGVAIATTLVLVQYGLYEGLRDTASAFIHRTGGDVWVMREGTEVVDMARPLDPRTRSDVENVACVKRVRAVAFAVLPAVKPNGALQHVHVVGVEPGGPTVPWNLRRGAAGDLDGERRVAIDESAAKKLQIGGDPMGGTIDVAGTEVRVAAVTHGIRSFALFPFVFSSIVTARSLAKMPADGATFWVADVERPACAVDVVYEARKRGLAARSTQAFADLNEHYWMVGSGAGAAIGFSAAFSLVIGAVIVGQTLYSITREHLKELATLKAMGASPREVVSFVAWQAGFLGVVGALIGFGLAASLRSVLAGQGTHVVLSGPVLGVSFGAVAIMCVVASAPCVRRVLRVEAAEVFR